MAKKFNSLGLAFANVKSTVITYYNANGKRVTHTIAGEHLVRGQVEQRMLMELHVPKRCIAKFECLGA